MIPYRNVLYVIFSNIDRDIMFVKEVFGLVGMAANHYSRHYCKILISPWHVRGHGRGGHGGPTVSGSGATRRLAQGD